jgi:hypothetical protein
MNCIICFSVIVECYECSDQRCKEQYCKECIEELLDFCISEKIMLKCPAKNCNSYLTITDLKLLEHDFMTKYYQLCLDVFLKDNKTILEKEIQEKELLKKYRDERQKFLQKSFPQAISLMANISFKSKLRRLDVQKNKILKIKPKLRSCINSTCSGYLDDNFTCCNCQSQFCMKCEKILDDNHQCKQEDLDCIQFINQLIKCPGCTLPVFKNEGCNNITCSNCGTNFLYTTGEIGGSGSHNTKIMVNVEQRYKLSKIYKIPKSCIEKLLSLESLEPKTISKESMLLPVKKYIETKDDKFAKILALRIDAYYQNTLKLKHHQWCLVELEKMLKNTLSEDDFSQRLDLFLETMK